ncbi:MAG: hypothetical protein O6934_10545 [SAR324 cluster bacterium]|nr:hypothetical protein [SAR324 cluster bacterium]
MFLDAIVGQEAAVAALRQMLASGRVPSALLFLGPHHVGKRTTALALARALNCHRNDGTACGVCPACRKIDAGVHPDVDVVVPDGQFIKIGQVREVSNRLGLIPREARKRVVVLARAERMNPPAAHAFLKTLEEPPVDTLIVLCAASAAELFDTITSRCLPLRFGLLPDPAVRSLLGDSNGLSAEVLEFAVRFARGRARQELRERAGQWLLIREELIAALARPEGQDFAELTDKSAKWTATEDWRFVLQWLETWFRDLAVLGGGTGSASLINLDREEALWAAQGHFPPHVAESCYRQVLAARAGMLLNANKALALDALWMGCREAVRNRTGGIL